MFQTIKNKLRLFGKARLPRPVRNALISVGVLLVVFVGGGIGYTYYMGLQPAVDSAAFATPVIATLEPVIKPTPQAANSKASASVQSLTSPVTLGSNTAMTVRTNPAATCTITVIYNNVASTDSGLGPKVADEYGMVSWSWTVDTTTPIGTWPVKVTCALNGRSAVVQADLQVVKQI